MTIKQKAVALLEKHGIEYEVLWYRRHADHAICNQIEVFIPESLIECDDRGEPYLTSVICRNWKKVVDIVDNWLEV